jgi:hypothetical protein
VHPAPTPCKLSVGLNERQQKTKGASTSENIKAHFGTEEK